MRAMRTLVLAAAALGGVAATAPAIGDDPLDAAIVFLMDPEADIFLPHWTNLALKKAQRVSLWGQEPAPPASLSLLPEPAENLWVMAKGNNGALVHRTVEASRGDVTVETTIRWPGFLVTPGDCFIQFNFHDAEGEVFQEIGVVGGSHTNGESGVPVGRCLTYGGAFASGAIQVPLTLDAGGSAMVVRVTLSGADLLIEAADATALEWITIANFTGAIDLENEPGHTIEVGYTGGIKGALVGTPGASITGAIHEFTGPALASIIAAFQQAHQGRHALEGSDFPTAGSLLDDAVGSANAAAEGLEGIASGDLKRAAVSEGTRRSAVKAVLSAKKFLEKALAAADASEADVRSVLKAESKLCTAGVKLKKLPAAACKRALATPEE
jgi:hypothetical protein